MGSDVGGDEGRSLGSSVSSSVSKESLDTGEEEGDDSDVKTSTPFSAVLFLGLLSWSGLGRKVMTRAEEVELMPVFCRKALPWKPEIRNGPLVLIWRLCWTLLKSTKKHVRRCRDRKQVETLVWLFSLEVGESTTSRLHFAQSHNIALLWTELRMVPSARTA